MTTQRWFLMLRDRLRVTRTRQRTYSGFYILVGIFAVFSITSCQALPANTPDNNKETAKIKAALSEDDDFVVPDEAIKAANEGLERWKGQDRLGGYFAHFSTGEVRLGEPYRVYKVPINAVVEHTSLSENDLIKRDAWYFPIIADDKYLWWIKASKASGKWEYAGFGGNSSRVQNLEKQLKEQSGSVKRALVGVAELGLDFIAIGKSSESGNAAILHADFYPYGLSQKEKNDVKAFQREPQPRSDSEVLSKMKETAELFLYKGVQR
jgi:hypothetical protein